MKNSSTKKHGERQKVFETRKPERWKKTATMEERVNELAVAEKDSFTSVEEMDNCGKNSVTVCAQIARPRALFQRF